MLYKRKLKTVIFEKICPISKTVKITENFKGGESIYLTEREIESLYSFVKNPFIKQIKDK